MSDALTEFIDAEIFVRGADTPGDEKNLLTLVEKIAGVAEARVAGGRLDVRYDPLSITKKELCERITAAGYTVCEIDAASASPLLDALFGGGSGS